jgi:hypothetical protein
MARAIEVGGQGPLATVRADENGELLAGSG